MSSVSLQTLPPDLLESIFVLLVRSTSYPGRTALDISHVCTLWREIALGCSRLWGIIDTRNKKISSLFVSRTRRSTPLDILAANPNATSPPSLFTKQVGKRPRWKENTFSSCESVLACLHNIRFLTLYLSYEELKSFSAAFTSGLPRQLISLTIIAPPTWTTDENSMEQTRVAALVPPILINPPNSNNNNNDISCGVHLKSLTLTDISLPWSDVCTSLQSLTYLAITSPVLKPSLKQIHSILRNAPLLERLILDDIFDDMDFHLDTMDSLRTQLSPISLPLLTTLSYNAISIRSYCLYLVLSGCIMAPLLDDISFQMPDRAHLYRNICVHSTDESSEHDCRCRMFNPSNLIPHSQSIWEEKDTRDAFLKRMGHSMDHFFITRDPYHPIRGGNGDGGYKYHIHGVTKYVVKVEYPSLIPFIRSPSSPDPRYTLKNQQGIMFSGYAYTSCTSEPEPCREGPSNGMPALISDLSMLVTSLINVRHLELATGGVEVLLMTTPFKDSITNAFAAVRHVTLWGSICSTAHPESNIFWHGSDINPDLISAITGDSWLNQQRRPLSLITVLTLLSKRLIRHSVSNTSEPTLDTLTLRHFKIDFTPELTEAIENLLGSRYSVVHVDLKGTCKGMSCSGTESVVGKKLELINCT
ncbi:hypothetical protein Clacol_004363 [Clathrus columnatus]|uniref:F-box domain-containing protein n=1 Tax=Clathrus columnatus TaxID=1419009 RepID=A0AAV5A9A4_9AGAM|nr:hypothetical protein Clacol_004363 [Clathrus columnatus]